jgi:hypothetical protein
MKTNLFRIVTGIAGIYHVLLAAIGLLFPVETTVKAFEIALGVNVAISPQLGFIGKFIAVYMLAFGIMLLLLSANTNKYRVFAWPAIALFGVRFINRVVFFGLVSSTFGMSTTRNMIGTVLIFLFFIVIYLTIPRRQS